MTIMDSMVVVTGGFSFLGALCLLLIGLKLGGVIGISWMLALAPILWPIYAVMGIVVIYVFWKGFSSIHAALKGIYRRTKRAFK